MKTYLLTILFVSVITGGLSYLSSGSSYEKQLRYLSMLLTLLALLTPLPALFSSYEATIPTLDLPAEQFASYATLLKEKTAERLNEQLSEEICRRCSLDKTEFSVNTVLSVDEEQSLLSVEGIEITLHSLSAIVKREQIRKITSEVSDRCEFLEKIGQNGGENIERNS